MNRRPLSLAVNRAKTNQMNVRQAPLPVSSWNGRHTPQSMALMQPQVAQQCMLDLAASLLPDTMNVEVVIVAFG